MSRLSQLPRRPAGGPFPPGDARRPGAERRLARRAAAGGAALLVLIPSCSVISKVNSARKGIDNLAHGTTGDKRLDALLAKFGEGQKATFKAVYTVHTTSTTATTAGSGAPAKPGTYTLEQKLPMSRLDEDSGDGQTLVFIDDGTSTWTCTPDANGTDANGKAQPGCLQGQSTSSSSGSDVGVGVLALGGFGALFNPTVFLGAFKNLAFLTGITITTRDFNKSVAGMDTQCVEAHVSGGKQKAFTSQYCATTDGILAYSDDGQGDLVELTSLARSVSDADFKPPSPPVTVPTAQPTPGRQYRPLHAP